MGDDGAQLRPTHLGLLGGSVLTLALDLLGVLCLATFAWFVWAPLPLAVVGVLALYVSWRRS
jgi:hypothetical protein